MASVASLDVSVVRPIILTFWHQHLQAAIISESHKVIPDAFREELFPSVESLFLYWFQGRAFSLSGTLFKSYSIFKKFKMIGTKSFQE